MNRNPNDEIRNSLAISDGNRDAGPAAGPLPAVERIHIPGPHRLQRVVARWQIHEDESPLFVSYRRLGRLKIAGHERHQDFTQRAGHGLVRLDHASDSAGTGRHRRRGGITRHLGADSC